MYDFREDIAQTYIETCKGCGRVVEVSIQQDHGSNEYDAEIYVRCLCGGSVRFLLPVN